MIVNKELANSKGVDQKDLWGTEAGLFEALNEIYNFTLDPCCTKDTALCDKFYTPTENGLIHSWSNEIVFMNPPYSRGNIDLWVEKAYNESENAIVVALIPVSTSAKWWHKWVIGKCHLVYVQGRVKFEGASSTAPFSSALAIYGEKRDRFFNIEKKRGGIYILNKHPSTTHDEL